MKDHNVATRWSNFQHCGNFHPEHWGDLFHIGWFNRQRKNKAWKTWGQKNAGNSGKNEACTKRRQWNK